MRSLLSLLLIVVALPGGRDHSDSLVDIEISGRVLDAESRALTPNIRVDVIDATSGDTLVADVRTDSLGRFATVISVTAIDEGDIRAGESEEPEIASIHPNPAASGAITVSYSADAGYGDPVAEVFDVAGREVGKSAVASGTYFVRLKFDDGTVTRSQAFVKLEGGAMSIILARSRTENQSPGGSRKQSASRTTAAAIRLVYSHPAYSTLTQDHNTSSDLTGLTAAIEPTFRAVEADESTYDVTYDASAIVIDGTARSALVEADLVNQVYTFDTATLATEGITLVAGSPMLIEGLALREITTVSQVGDKTVVETAFAPLTDLIESGTMSWSHTARVDATTMKRATVAGKSANWSAPGDSLFFEYALGPYEYKILLKPSPSDTVRTHMTVQVTKSVGEKLAATFVGKGELKEFQSAGDISISNNEAETVDIENNNVRMEIEMSLAAAGSGLDALNWEMPEVGLPITFAVGPVPVTLNVIVQVVLQMSVINEASATATTKLSYDGSTGFHYDGTDVSMSQETVDHLLGQTAADPAASIGNVVDANLGIAFPKLTVDIFGVPIVPSFLVGFVVGTGLQWGPVCKTAYVSAEVKAGLDFELFDLTVPIAEKELWKQRKDAPPC